MKPGKLKTARTTAEFNNPWHDPRNQLSRAVYRCEDAKTWVSDCGRGIIVSRFPGSFLYIINGRPVTERAGMTKGYDILQDLIDHILDGKPAIEPYDTPRAMEAYNRGDQN